MQEKKEQAHPVISRLSARVLFLHKVSQVVIVVKVEQRHQLLGRKVDILYCSLTNMQ